MELKFEETNWAVLNVSYDASVDADYLPTSSSSASGEVNLTWEIAIPGSPNFCDYWMGKVQHCDNYLWRSDPSGICCSTSSLALCAWNCS